MKKRMITGILAVIMTVSLAGCSGTGEKGSSAGSTTEAVSEAASETASSQDTAAASTTASTASTEAAESQTAAESSDGGQVSFTSAAVFYPVFEPNEIKEKSIRMETPVDENKIMAALQDEEVLDESCKILSYEKNGDTIKVDFNSECGVLLMRMAPEEANMRAEAVAKTFCRNLVADQFYFYTNGHPLETGNKTYDEPIGVN